MIRVEDERKNGGVLNTRDAAHGAQQANKDGHEDTTGLDRVALFNKRTGRDRLDNVDVVDAKGRGGITQGLDQVVD